MIDFRKYHQAHEMLINLQRGLLSAESIVGNDFSDPRRSAVSYLASKILRAKSGEANLSVFLGRHGQPFFSQESAERSKPYRLLKRGGLVLSNMAVVKSFDVQFIMEIGGFAVVVKYDNEQKSWDAA
jgi:hypothetical protein